MTPSAINRVLGVFSYNFGMKLTLFHDSFKSLLLMETNIDLGLFL